MTRKKNCNLDVAKKLNYNNFKITCYMNVKIDKISEISSFFVTKDQPCSILTRLYRVLDLGKHSKSVSKLKQQGSSLPELLYGLLLLRICGLTVYAGSKKDYWNLLSCRVETPFTVI